MLFLDHFDVCALYGSHLGDDVINTHFVPLLVWAIRSGTRVLGDTMTVALSCMYVNKLFFV